MSTTTSCSSSIRLKRFLFPTSNLFVTSLLILLFIHFVSVISSSNDASSLQMDIDDRRHYPASMIVNIPLLRHKFLKSRPSYSYSSTSASQEVSATTIPTSCTFPSSELSTLQSLYDATGGKHWIWSTSPTAGIPWNFTQSSPNPCTQQWQGITCNYNVDCTISTLTLHHNNMTGILPPTIGNFINISTISIGNNTQLQGILPSELGALLSLRTLEIYDTHIGGTIPTSFGNLIYLQELKLYHNRRITGNIPNIFTTMTHLITLDLERNNLQGSLPTSIYTLPKLKYLMLRQNQLSGSIIDAIGNLQALEIFDVNRNAFTGSLPDTIGSLVHMNYFYLFINQFTGTLPSSIKQWLNLEYFSIDANKFQGVFPDLSTCSKLQFIRIDDNHFHSTLPNMFSNMLALSLFNASTNFFYGTLPSSLAISPVLTSIDVSDNSLSGSVEDLFSTLPSLQQLILNDNQFTGNLDAIFNTTTQPNITIVDVSNNQFTGQLPVVIFDLPKISVFAATKNCFKGYVPSNICRAQDTMTSLVLSGLHTAMNCQQQIYYGVRTYYLSGPLRGVLPSCLFDSYSQLETLDLSGNGILGTIPDVSSVSPSLTKLSLSHNRLTGTIPLAIQFKPWTTLDLSFNKLGGHLHSDIYDFHQDNTSLVLRVNRLSGAIPSSLLEASSIKILEGNMFECDQFDRTSLPDHDPYSDSYSCGSDSTNNTLVLWILCMVVFLVGTLLISRHFLHMIAPSLNSIRANIINYFAIFKSTEYPAFYEYGLTMEEIRRWVGTLTIVVLVILVPVYYTMSLFYGTFESQYVWNVSIAFKSGRNAALIMLAFFIVLLYIFYSKNCRFSRINILRILHKITENSKVEVMAERISLADSTHSVIKDIQRFYKWYLIVIGLLVVNFAIVMTVNMAFVYAMSVSIPVTLKEIITIAVSLFKVVWNGVVINVMYDEMKKSLHGFNVTPHEELEKRMRLTTLMLWVSIFNSIMAPLLAIAFISVDCFYLTLVPSPAITTTVSFTQCIDNPTIASDESIVVTNSCDSGYFVSYEVSYNPQYTYSYQCISTLLTNFANVFLYRYIFNGIIQPVILILLKWMHEYSYEHYGPNSKIFLFLSITLPPILQHTNLPTRPGSLQRAPTVSMSGRTPTNSLGISRPSYITKLEIAISESGTSSVRPTLASENNTTTTSKASSPTVSTAGGHASGKFSATDVERTESANTDTSLTKVASEQLSLRLNQISAFLRPYLEFNMYSIIISFATDIGIFVTFGVIFPPLAVVAWTTIVLQTYFVQLCLGRVVFLSKSQPSMLQFVEDLSADCIGVSAMLVRCLSSLANLILFIWSWFLLDMMADELALRRSIWVFFMLPIFRIYIHLEGKIKKYFKVKEEVEVDRFSKDQVSGRSTYGDVDLELKNINLYAPDSDDDEDDNDKGSVVMNPITSAKLAKEISAPQPPPRPTLGKADAVTNESL